MDKPKANNLSELTDEQIDAISGGYILDLCGMSNPTEYALVDDKTGDVICYANTLKGLKETKAARRCSDERTGAWASRRQQRWRGSQRGSSRSTITRTSLAGGRGATTSS